MADSGASPRTMRRMKDSQSSRGSRGSRVAIASAKVSRKAGRGRHRLGAFFCGGLGETPDGAACGACAPFCCRSTSGGCEGLV